MAMTILQAQTLRDQKPFRDRVRNALVGIAQNVYSESTGTTGHVARAAKASLVMNNPDAYLTSMVDNIAPQLDLVNTTMSAGNGDCDVTDTALRNFISAIWNGFSGA